MLNVDELLISTVMIMYVYSRAVRTVYGKSDFFKSAKDMSNLFQFVSFVLSIPRSNAFPVRIFSHALIVENYQEHVHARVCSALTYSVLQSPGVMPGFTGDGALAHSIGLCFQG